MAFHLNAFAERQCTISPTMPKSVPVGLGRHPNNDIDLMHCSVSQIYLRYFFLLLLVLLGQTSISQNPPYCLLPTNLKSTCLTYLRLAPIVDSAGNDLRFFFQTVVGCGQDNASDLHDLFVYNLKAGIPVLDLSWQLDSFSKITGVIDPCLSLPAAPCYTIYYYHADANLGNLGPGPFGFVASSINCCRTGDAVNIFFQPPFMDLLKPPPPPYYCSEYPGLKYPAIVDNGIVSFIHVPPLSLMNSSPHFTNTDTILFLCKNRSFSYPIQAADPDGDSLAYHFSQPRTFYSPAGAVYDFAMFPQVLYNGNFSVGQPAGGGVTLDQSTGMLQGTMPDTGTYILTISVPEYRNGQAIDSITKDLFIRVYDCSLLPKPKASIPDSLNSCSSFTVDFPNNSFPIYNVNFNNTTFLWNFGDGGTSALVYPSHTYSDTGTFAARVIIFPGLYCADTANCQVLVYPYVNPAFTYKDSCSDKAIEFSNTSTSSSGAIDFTQWRILMDSTQLFHSTEDSIAYTFQKAPQTYTVLLTIGNDRGCMATDTQYISISQSPYPLASHDTILARGATLQLEVNDGSNNYNGQYTWWPAYGLSSTSVPDPVLTSTVDTTYYVSIVNRYGCSLEDSIRVDYYAGPNIYVPNAFTPNGDGVNDIFRPILVGISEMSYFRVFNRNGQLVYETSKPGQGWDGNIHGVQAALDTYVWEVRGIDYSGKSIAKKGTVVLIR
jgi:gliding motility-associated-like protein